MEAKQVKGLMEAYASVYANISESHFKVGDEVICKASGMEGEVIKLDKPDGEDDEKYYTVKREDGKTMKYAPNDLKLAKKEKEEKEEKEDVKEAKNGGISGSSETKFHKKLDSLVHHTFGKRKEEKAMKEETDEGGKHKEGKHPKGKEEPGEKVTEKEGKEKEGKEKEEKEMKESADLFDYILEHLVAEGYADTNKAALAIMANMSEEWKQSIVEGGFNISGRYDVGGGRTVGPVAGAVRSLFSGNLPKGQTYVPPTKQTGPNRPPAVPASKDDSGKLTDFGAGGGKAKLKTGMSVGQVERQGRMNKGDYSG